MKAISLFSGMGGDTLGMKQAGIDVVAYSEKEVVFQETHEANFPNSKLIGPQVKSDILKIPDEDFAVYKNEIDFLFAGFPCQSFSTGGKRKVNDPRNTMFREFVRATRLIKPKVIIGENVKGLLTKKTEDGALYIDVIVNEFRKLGYEVDFKIMAAHKYGVPQKRERLIIIGIHKDHLGNGFNLSFPEETSADNPPGINDIIEFSMEGTKIINNTDIDFSQIPMECLIQDLKNNDSPCGKPHPYLELKLNPPTRSYQGKDYTTLFSFAKRDSPIHCEVIDIRKPSKTIICTYDHAPRLFVPIKNKKGNYLRMMLPSELKQIQGFPADYIVKGNDKKQIVQIGNAVPPPMIKLVVERILGKV